MTDYVVMQRPAKLEWHDCNDSLPPRNTSCLVRYLYGLYEYDKISTPWISHGYIEYYFGEWIVDSQFPLPQVKVTHWAIMPEGPEL